MIEETQQTNLNKKNETKQKLMGLFIKNNNNRKYAAFKKWKFQTEKGQKKTKNLSYDERGFF